MTAGAASSCPGTAFSAFVLMNPNLMSSFLITYYDRVTLRPLNELSALHDPDFTIQVVPGYLADADNGRISEDAPLGRAVLRHRHGDTLTLNVQGRSVSMRILAVEKHAENADVGVALRN
jgi:hypothetical protein